MLLTFCKHLHSIISNHIFTIILVVYLFEWYKLNSYCRLNVKDLYFQGSDSWAEAPREYQPIPIHFSHHQQSSGTLYNPCLRKKARLPPKVWKMEIIKLCRFTCRFVKIYQSSYQCFRSERLFSLSSDIRNYWTPTRPPTTSSVAQCVG